jgi:hypothetical protein
LPCDVQELVRGAVCLALYPFSTSFPVERVERDAGDRLLAQLENVPTIEDLEARIAVGDPPSELVALFKLRRVLVLHKGTNRNVEDVAVARINSVTDAKRAREKWWRRMQDGTHLTQLLIGSEAWHGTNGREAYVDATHIALIPKTTMLRRTGLLNDDEMRAVSARLMNVLEIDPTATI